VYKGQIKKNCLLAKSQILSVCFTYVSFNNNTLSLIISKLWSKIFLKLIFKQLKQLEIYQSLNVSFYNKFCRNKPSTHNILFSFHLVSSATVTVMWGRIYVYILLWKACIISNILLWKVCCIVNILLWKLCCIFNILLWKLCYIFNKLLLKYCIVNILLRKVRCAVNILLWKVCCVVNIYK